jgi:hypothetical protein
VVRKQTDGKSSERVVDVTATDETRPRSRHPLSESTSSFSESGLFQNPKPWAVKICDARKETRQDRLVVLAKIPWSGYSLARIWDMMNGCHGK